MSCDHELTNEWARYSGKNASYITIYDFWLFNVTNILANGVFHLREKNADVSHHYLTFGKRVHGKSQNSDLGQEKQCTLWNSNSTNTTTEEATIANDDRFCGIDGGASRLFVFGL